MCLETISRIVDFGSPLDRCCDGFGFLSTRSEGGSVARVAAAFATVSPL